MNGAAVISALMNKFKVTTDRALADKLGVTAHSILYWKNRPTVTTRQFAGLVYHANLAGGKSLQAIAIRPLVEFFPTDACESRQGSNYEIFGTGAEGGGKHPYLKGLRKELEGHRGIYIFFDSRGHAIYTGKARRQNLWKEMNLAFNRNRGYVQSIKRVNHPTRKLPYRTSDEKIRQITDHVVPLHELAAYFSAYQVADGMIDDVEAMLIRCFANDILNKKIEKFGTTKRRKKSA